MNTASNSKPMNIVAWVLQIALAGAFIAMGAIPKLTGDYMAVQIFEQVGMGQGFRYVVGVIELGAAVLLLIPKTRVIGGLAAAGAMVGAIGSHTFTPLGWMPELAATEGADPEAMPLVVFAAVFLALSLVVVFLRRDELPLVGKKSEALGDSAA